MPDAAAPIARRLSAQAVAAQIDVVLAAWGLPDAPRADAVEIMSETDLRGIDSHGVSMLPIYDVIRRDGRLNMQPTVRVVADAKAVQVLDADAGLGYHPGKRAIATAVERAKAYGLGAVAVRNSNHFGAAGAYALRAAQAGCIGLVTTNSLNPTVVPTRSRQRLFGTNPLAFAAPARAQPPFVLDMATSTVAVGKLKLRWLAGQPLPPGWAVDATGAPETDSERAFGRLQGVPPDVGLTPLGGLAETASHKGYGLAAMVEILSATLAGAAFIGTRIAEGRRQNDIGHFFLAIDPAAFREAGAFEAEMDVMIETMRALAPADPALPVLVPGDPEAQARAERERDGVPVPERLWNQMRDLCAACGAPFLWNA